jgi:S1-C subfamily serine protease
MPLWTLLVLVPGQLVDSADFPKALQHKAAAATVRVVNRADRIEGSGAMIAKKDGATYVLTAAHLVNRPGRLEVSTFTKDSYPLPAKVYDNVELVARTRDIRDLAILRFKEDAPPGVLSLCPGRLVPQKTDFECLSVGCGAARAPVCFLETVAGAGRVRRPGSMESALFWETAIGQPPGRSGGPLLDRQGYIIGVASGASEGRGYYCHLLEIRRWLKASGNGFLADDEDQHRK